MLSKEQAKRVVRESLPPLHVAVAVVTAMVLVSGVVTVSCGWDPNAPERHIPTHNSGVGADGVLHEVRCKAGAATPRDQRDIEPRYRNMMALSDQTLDIFAKAMAEIGVEWFPVYGTLLGWYRECDFLPHDHDVDIGFWYEDADRIPDIVAALHQHGLGDLVRDSESPTHNSAPGGPPLFQPRTIQLLYHGAEKVYDAAHFHYVDLWFWHREEGYFWSSQNGGYTFFAYSPFELCPGVLNGRHIKVPCDPERMLNELYGEPRFWNTSRVFKDNEHTGFANQFFYPEWVWHPEQVFMYFTFFVPLFALVCWIVFRLALEWARTRKGVRAGGYTRVGAAEA